MNKRTANKVLAELEATHAEFIAAGFGRPTLRDADHEGLPKGSFSIDWELGPENWSSSFFCTVPGVYVEAINHWLMGVYDR